MQQQERANASLSRLIESNPGCSVNTGQPEWLVGTNFVTFGAFHGQPAVFKYFDWRPRREQEEKALRLFAPTGLVPKLFPVESDSVLVMERLRGSTLNVYEQNAEQELLEQIFHQLGQAIARIVAAAPGSRAGGRRHMSSKPGFDYPFYCQVSLGTAFDTIIGRAAKALAEQDVPDRTVLEKSLVAIADHRDSILAYPSFVQMDDFHTCNIMADGPELTGFVDLEMSRYGNKVLVLAAALNASGRRPHMWRALHRGFEEECRETLDSDLLSLVRICAPFSTWIRFMWYWSTDELPHWAVEENLREAAIRDIKAAVETAEGIEL
jgi:hypothetical protein